MNTSLSKWKSWLNKTVFLCGEDDFYIFILKKYLKKVLDIPLLTQSKNKK